jgi:hypothetical protein
VTVAARQVATPRDDELDEQRPASRREHECATTDAGERMKRKKQKPSAAWYDTPALFLNRLLTLT